MWRCVGAFSSGSLDRELESKTHSLPHLGAVEGRLTGRNSWSGTPSSAAPAGDAQQQQHAQGPPLHPLPPFLQPVGSPAAAAVSGGSTRGAGDRALQSTRSCAARQQGGGLESSRSSGSGSLGAATSGSLGSPAAAPSPAAAAAWDGGEGVAAGLPPLTQRPSAGGQAETRAAAPPLPMRVSRSLSGAGRPRGSGFGAERAVLEEHLSLDDATLMRQVAPALGGSALHAVLVQPLTGSDDKVRGLEGCAAGGGATIRCLGAAADGVGRQGAWVREGAGDAGQRRERLATQRCAGV